MAAPLHGARLMAFVTLGALSDKYNTDGNDVTLLLQRPYPAFRIFAFARGNDSPYRCVIWGKGQRIALDRLAASGRNLFGGSSICFS
jgi:hypothetical protein